MSSISERIRVLSLVGVLLTTTACGAQERKLCPGGSQGLSLNLRSEMTTWLGIGGAFATSGLGTAFVRIGNDCQYWVGDGSWFTKHGTLDAAQEEHFHDALRFDELADSEGDWGDGYDCQITTSVAADSTSRCVCGCPAEAPAALRHAEETLIDSATEMGKMGTLWDGPRRLVVEECVPLSGATRPEPPLYWPASYPIEDYLWLPTPEELGNVPPGVEMTQDLEDTIFDLLGQQVTLRGVGYDQRITPLILERESCLHSVRVRDVLPFSDLP